LVSASIVTVSSTSYLKKSVSPESKLFILVSVIPTAPVIFSTTKYRIYCFSAKKVCNLYIRQRGLF
jgi:hypothetical protein